MPRKLHLINARRRAKGQATVEMALVSLLLAMLLAAAVDFGRAYYTDVLVTNMAAEGALYASLNPDFDKNYPTAGSCSAYPVDPNGSKNIQARVGLVATEHGLVIKQGDLSVISTTISVVNNPPFPNPTDCSNRCFGRRIQVQVRYTIHDLFLPRLLGMNGITIVESASQQIQRNAAAASCGN
jgi:hypothetical protein